MAKIKVGISACLLGHNVRFNGSNCHKKWLSKTLAQYFSYQVVCPEVAAGFGVPRPVMCLVQDEHNAERHLILRDEQHSDVSTQLAQASQKILQTCAELSGFIVKRGSPSCGAGSTKLYNAKLNVLRHNADGEFVRRLKMRFPHLPIEDEGRLNDVTIREHFIKLVYLYHAAQRMLTEVNSLSALEDFHMQHKFILRLHHGANQKYLGRLLAAPPAEFDLSALKQHYFNCFAQSFAKPVKPSQHYALLQRAFRSINCHLDSADRADIQTNLRAYLQQLVPLAVPMALLRHYSRHYRIGFLQQQSYLYPYPDELALMRSV